MVHWAALKERYGGMASAWMLQSNPAWQDTLLMLPRWITPAEPHQQQAEVSVFIADNSLIRFWQGLLHRDLD